MPVTCCVMGISAHWAAGWAAWSAACLKVFSAHLLDMGGRLVHLLMRGSRRSTVFRYEAESKPPIAYKQLSEPKETSVGDNVFNYSTENYHIARTPTRDRANFAQKRRGEEYLTTYDP